MFLPRKLGAPFCFLVVLARSKEYRESRRCLPPPRVDDKDDLSHRDQSSRMRFLLRRIATSTYSYQL
eukprot:4437059-Amphidinium_carterae.1